MKKGFRVLMLVSGLLIVLLFMLPFIPRPDSSTMGLGAFLGRLHPMIVHFPIVLLLVPLLLEGYGLWKKEMKIRQAVDLLLPLAILSSLAAVLVGYLLYRSGDYSGDLVRNHLWGGVLVSISALLAGIGYLYFRMKDGQRSFHGYMALLILSNGVLIYTGHQGGSLTHGADYLTAALPDWGGDIELKDPDEMEVFEDVIMGIFQSKCLNCHNPHKAKGGLVMSSFEELTEGGKSEKPMLISGQPDSSELYVRIALPDKHDDHMPPSGKPDLTEAEIDIIHEWIAGGGQVHQRLDSSSMQLKQLVQTYMPHLLRFQRKRMQQQAELAETYAELKETCHELNLHVEPDPDADSLLFALSMQLPPRHVDDQTVQKLLPYAEVFSKISLPASQITDEGTYFLSQFPNLQRLYLQKTCITGEGLVYLRSLPQLEVLGLSYTNIDDAAALELLEFPALKRVYLFQTDVGVNMVQALDKRMEGTRVLSEEGAYY